MDARSNIIQKAKSSARTSHLQAGRIPESILQKRYGYLILLVLVVLIGISTSLSGVIALGIPALLLCITVASVCIVNAEAALYIIIAYSFFISFINRLFLNNSLLIGIPSDILIATTFLGFLIRKADLKSNINEFSKNRVVIILMFLYGYTAIQVFNPYGNLLTGWFPAVRKVLATFLLLFIAYNVFNTHEKIHRFIKVIFSFSVIVALYTCVQEFYGFFNFELTWLQMDEKRFRMTFVNGGARKMSTFPDALSLSIVMATTSVFFIGFLTGVKKLSNRLILITGIAFLLLAMSFSLTRTANVMVIAGLILFILITFDKKISRIAGATGLLLFLILLYAPTNNTHVYQFRNTFKGGTKDPSYIVREVNRARIQPYLYSHPIGGGLNTTGTEGLKNNPSHPLAGFPPDSGYLKKALEIGWIGFALLLFLYFTIIKTAVRGYFSCTDNKTKVLFASCAASFFASYMGDYTQEAIGQITDIVVYFPMIAIVLRLRNAESLNKPLTT